MTEDQARDWLQATFGVQAFDLLTRYVNLLSEEAERQSLIARSTISSMWSRHIADSAQLVSLAPPVGRWLDIGSGGGLPGVVVSILRDQPITMSEPRRKRAEFLADVCEQLGLSHATVSRESAERQAESASVISARAVAPLTDLFRWTRAVVSRGTIYILPRGEHALDDVAIARRAWQGEFHVEQSITDPRSGIVVAQNVKAL